MNLADLTHSLLTGRWRLDREIVREQRERYYAGARRTINRPSPQPLSGTEDYRKASERIVLIRAAREMEEDGGFFDGILDDFETYVVGDQLVYMPNTGNEDANKVIREYVEWQFDQADYSERHDLTKIAQLAVRTFQRDGECGFVPVDVGDAIKIHSYEADCIGNPTMAASTQPFDYNGIVVSQRTNAPVRYNLFRRAPKTQQYTFDRSIQAEHFWHLFDAFRLHQFHGVSAFKNSVRDAYDIDQILEFTKLNIKWRSSQLPTVHTPYGKPPSSVRSYNFIPRDDDPNAPVGQVTAKQIDVDGVSTSYLQTGDAVIEYPNDFPNAQLHVTLEEFRRQCCKGAKLPYEFVYRADNGGVVQRFWVNKAENTFNKVKHLLRRVLLNPFKNRVIQKGIDTGELDLSRFGDLDVSLMRYRGAWQMGKPISVDYGKENDTDIKLIDAGLMSQQDKAASMGTNLDDVDAELESAAVRKFEIAERIGKRFNIPTMEAMAYVLKKYPNPPANPAPAQVPNDQSAPELAEVVNLKEALRIERADKLLLKSERDIARWAANAQALQKPVVPNVTVNNTPAAVTVNVPEQPAPVVHMKAPTVKVENKYAIEAAAAPSVTVQAAAAPNVVVNVPQQPAPTVNVTNEIPPLTATLKIDRGADGKMTGGKITE